MANTEAVVLLSETGDIIGSADKALVHTDDTPLHLAFSCYLFDEHQNVLVTRRALNKKTWPGVWSNSFCGHPEPDESLVDAVRRRAKFELGAEIVQIREVLPDFRYRAIDSNGIVENEVCPVFIATIKGDLAVNPDEVMAYEWTDLASLTAVTELTPWAFSPWAVLQIPLLISDAEFG